MSKSPLTLGVEELSADFYADFPDGAPVVVDCKSELGITVGLIDSIIAISRVLAPRLERERGSMVLAPLIAAMRDIQSDADIKLILTLAVPPEVQG